MGCEENSVKHFLDLADWTSEDLWAMIKLAVELKEQWRTEGNPPLLAGRTLAMVFSSCRCGRGSALKWGWHLGGHALYPSPQEIGLGKRESIADTPRVGVRRCIAGTAITSRIDLAR
jgi:ornithine carbamoyltransferase